MRISSQFPLKLTVVLALLVLGAFAVMARLSFAGIHLSVSELLESRAEGAAAGAALLVDPAWLQRVDAARPETAPGYAEALRRLEGFRAAAGLTEVEVYRPEANGKYTVLLRAGRRPAGSGAVPGTLAQGEPGGLYAPWQQSGARSLESGKVGWYPVRDATGAPVAVVHAFLAAGEAAGRIATLNNTLLLLLVGVAMSLLLMAWALIRSRESAGIFRGLLRTLTAAIDARDPYTQGHSSRVSLNAAAIARRLGLPERDVDRIRSAGMLHDIGKIGVRDAILMKPGKLSAEEWEALKEHTSIGARILEQSGALQDLLAGVQFHHERMDGLGYPLGLRGESIPMDARILAVADAFDAMTSHRSYQPARDPEHALMELRRVAGAQVDVKVVEALADLYAEGEISVSPPDVKQGVVAAAHVRPR